MNAVSPVNPAINISPPAPVADRPVRDDLKRAEAEVLRQERLLRNSEDVASTVYHYSVSADGRPYITGATVTMRTSAEKEAGGGTEKPAGNKETETPKEAARSGESPGRNPDSDPEVAAEAAKLKIREREVIAHEAAHKSVGGQYAGAVSYSYVTGPDGRRYIAGGEVSISAPEGRTPEETVQIMEQVKRAALAPASPSPQDMKVAAAASAAQMRARAEMAKQGAIRAYAGSGEKDEAGGEPFSLVA